MITKCTFCGLISRNQADGNGCHGCSKGYMIKFYEDERLRRNEFEDWIKEKTYEEKL